MTHFPYPLRRGLRSFHVVLFAVHNKSCHPALDRYEGRGRLAGAGSRVFAESRRQSLAHRSTVLQVDSSGVNSGINFPG